MSAEVPSGFVPAVGMDPAEEHIGPFFLLRDGTACETGFIPVAHHTNSMGTVHGGVLMTFADFTLCAVGKTGSSDAHIMTVSITTEFVHPARADQWLRGYGTISRRTRSLVFVQGQLLDEDVIVMTFSGIGKRIRNDGQGAGEVE